ncbi:MAG: EF-hand domain-containing protein [Planctomyces sp.]|nr:EF-hand domain-containing protein [Planctomyces sp.]
MTKRINNRIRKLAAAGLVAASAAAMPAIVRAQAAQGDAVAATPLDELRAKFLKLDSDGDGRVTCEEYVDPHRGGQFEDAAREEAARADGDGDGVLTLAEFLATPHGAAPPEVEFGVLDADGNGRLTRDEFLAPSSQYARRERFFNADRDGDGELTLEEFLAPAEEWRPHIRARYLMRDVNNDGRMSKEEYYTPLIGGQWEEAGRSEAEIFDADGDGIISLFEFAMGQIWNLNDQELLSVFDSNSDGHLSRLEFIRRRPQDKWFEAAVEFLRRDANGDNVLTLDELATGQEPVCIDPVLELARERLAAFDADWSRADRDGDGRVSRSDWPSAAAARCLGRCGGLAFDVWDINRDGSVSREELERIVMASHSVVRMDGAPLRTPAGVVVNWAFIDAKDRNRDNRITLMEYSSPSGGMNAAREFNEFDADRNGVLDDVELIHGLRFAINTCWDFCRLDTDLDGQLTGAELENGAQEWQKKMTPRIIAAFDADGDNRLSFREYRMTPFANPLIEWYDAARYRDVDGDGRLSWEEFHPQDAPQFMDVSRIVFDGFDVDRDGRLSTKEFDFQWDISRAPAQIAFAALDRNEDGWLKIDDVPNLERPAGNDPGEKIRWEERVMQIEDALATADADGDGVVSFKEFEKHRQLVAAAMLGQPIPRPTLAAGVIRDGLGNWRFPALVVANVLMLIGLGWFVLRRET